MHARSLVQINGIQEILTQTRCEISYIEKSIKFKGEELIREKFAVGLVRVSPSDWNEILQRWGASPSTLSCFQTYLEEMEHRGYRQDKETLHLGKEYHQDVWRSEVYVRQFHAKKPRWYGTSMDLTTTQFSHYEVFIETWIEALMRLRTFFSNTEYNALSYVLGHAPDITHQHLCKIDARYLYNMYFSVFLPYEEVKTDIYELVTTFTGKDFRVYESAFQAFPVLAMVHVSQEVNGPRQFSLYFRAKDI